MRRIKPELINPKSLSPEGRWTLRQVLVRQEFGETLVEIAARHGVSRYVIYRRIDRLAREIAGEVQPKRLTCVVCGESLRGSQRLYCSGKHKVAGHRQEQRTKARVAARAATEGRKASSRSPRQR